MRDLVAVDDYTLGALIIRRLSTEGHDVDWVNSREHALAYALQHEPDLIVLDLGVTRGAKSDGLDILRKRPLSTSILVLTEQSQIMERVQCLDMGAEDCLSKPFYLKEFIARCRAIFRRNVRCNDRPLPFEELGDRTIEFGDLRIDRIKREVTLSGSIVKLSTKEFLLVEALVKQRGECVSKANLLHNIWPELGMDTSCLAVYVRAVRKKLAVLSGNCDLASPLIENVHGQGYRIRPGVFSPPPVMSTALSESCES
jgi:DNA-binding response OmpR family regulator